MRAGHATSTGNPRVAAARVVEGVLSGRSLSELIPQHLADFDAGRDRSLAQELSYGTLRYHPRLHRLIGRLLKKPLKAKDRDVEALLLIGAYQLLYLRVADHAAVHETAGAANQLGKRWAVGLVNGVLRGVQRQQERLLAELAWDAVARYSMPAWLLKALQARWPENWESCVAAMNERPPMTLRVNQRQMDRATYLERLADEGIQAKPNPVTKMGVDLERPVEAELLPGFASGWVSVQDGAAQLAAGLLDLSVGQQVLDACAAPGGKSCHLLESEPGIVLTAMDIDESRLARVSENLSRLNLQADLLQGDAAEPDGDWAERDYDRILLDVPCSATGVIRRHPDIKILRRESDIDALTNLQTRILEAVWPRLKPGGLMLYVTCSVLERENEGQLVPFLSRHDDAQERPIEADWGEARVVGRQIRPGETGIDGFFYALLEKRK
ncbi:MAG: 16S rRNA (cytosine(967)-C(5))-methyltransferase RsmB [Candidatus Thiodiazotropha sp. (ex Monitilora ramsayi)]|nr:16S rRNA (cytosine(967)-C(5))-methyltransferase RsmB [Candidatus Thiodiazotropha sp. (ex Monitilora ramsayi)]